MSYVACMHCIPNRCTTDAVCIAAVALQATDDLDHPSLHVVGHLFGGCVLQHQLTPHPASHQISPGQWLLGSGTATTATAATTAVTTAAAKAAAPPAGGGFAVKLALLQWGLFVLPSFAWVQRRGWDMLQTFKLRPAGMRHYITGGSGQWC